MDKSLTLLVDASSLIYRAYYSTPDTVRAPDGMPVNAAHGFLGMLARLVSDHHPDYLCCATDDDWRPEWRVQLIETYKTHRTETANPQQVVADDLEPQMDLSFELLALCGVPVAGLAEYEAEDVIGTLAARAPGKVAIVSGDRDLFQLVRDPKVVVLYPRRGVSVLDKVDEAYIESRYGIPGTAYADFAILRGDPSDGLPGVRGIGEKTAASLVSRLGGLDAIVADAQEPGGNVALAKVNRALDYIERARKVVTIPTDLDLGEVNLATTRTEPPAETFELAARYGLQGALQRLADALTGAGSQGQG